MQDKRKSRILSSWPKPPSEAPQISYPRKIRQTKEKTGFACLTCLASWELRETESVRATQMKHLDRSDKRQFAVSLF
jgi:hypothetical protein